MPPKVQLPQLSNLQSWQELLRYTSIGFEYLNGLLNGGLQLANHVQGVVISAKFSVANQDVTFQHGLGFIPSKYFVVGATTELTLYDGSKPSDIKGITLKSSAIGTARILIC